MDTQENTKVDPPLPKREDLIWGLPRSVAAFVVVAVVSAGVYRMVTMQCNLQFDFPAFFSLLLALFAVGLSALFYFKATETSNAFYDTTHKFTREVSQILGRIEAGFGERLRHLDEGYTGLRDRFEKLPFDVSKAREQEQEEKEEVAKKEAELQALLNDLAKRAKLAETEKSELFATLEKTQEEVAMSRRELRHVQRRIRSAEDSAHLDPGFRDYLSNWLTDHRSPRLNSRTSSPMVNREFTRTLDDFSKDARHYMKRHDLLDEDDDLTPEGVRLIQSILRKS